MDNKLEQLFSKIEEKENEKYIYRDDYLEMDLEVKKLTLRRLAQLQDNSDKNTLKAIEATYQTIYEHIPLFQSPEILEKFDIKLNKYSVVAKIYNQNMKAITKLFNYINKVLYGIDNDESEELEKK